MALVAAQKGSFSISEYFTKMKTLADDMASAGKRLDDEEIASYILAGLDVEYNPVVSAVGRGRSQSLLVSCLHSFHPLNNAVLFSPVMAQDHLQILLLVVAVAVVVVARLCSVRLGVRAGLI